MMGDFGRSRLEALIERFRSLRIAVLGDYFLDKYLEVDPALGEASLETGKIAHQVVEVRHSPGAAGTVVNNLASLMGRLNADGGAPAIRAVGLVGMDGEGWELRQDLSALGVDISSLLTDSDPGRRTPVYLKPRDMRDRSLSGEHSRYDIKNRRPTGPEAEKALIEALDRVLSGIDALVVMDQVEDDGYGAVTREVRRALEYAANRRAPPLLWADSRRRISGYPKFMRKMNEFELLSIFSPKPGEYIEDEVIAARLPIAEAEAGAPVFVTCGACGVWVGSERGPTRIPAVRIVGAVDSTGAGDSFTAGTVLALAAGAEKTEAALVGTLVASVTVRKLGMTGTASPEELLAAYEEWKEQNP